MRRALCCTRPSPQAETIQGSGNQISNARYSDLYRSYTRTDGRYVCFCCVARRSECTSHHFSAGRHVVDARLAGLGVEDQVQAAAVHPVGLQFFRVGKYVAQLIDTDCTVPREVAEHAFLSVRRIRTLPITTQESAVVDAGRQRLRCNVGVSRLIPAGVEAGAFGRRHGNARATEQHVEIGKAGSCANANAHYVSCSIHAWFAASSNSAMGAAARAA